MLLKKTIKSEVEVAFSKHAQPAWFRIVKYAVLVTTFYFFWREKAFWIGLAIVFVFGLMLHLWYRYKVIKHMAGQKVIVYGSMKNISQSMSTNSMTIK